MPQKVVEQGAKIGLDDVELASRYRHNLGKVIDNFKPVAGNLGRDWLAIGAQV